MIVGAVILLSLGGTATAGDPKVDFEKYTLPNGLEVILHQDNSVPLVAVDVWYHVGSGNEVPGRSGFAHLFEHMLFQGSVHVGEDKHFSILQNIGVSQVNGSTSTDRTNYYEVVPSNQLETALWLESDRMGYFLSIVTEKSFRNQVDVVRNERRQRVDNVPYGPSYMKRAEIAYSDKHPYKYGVIGRHQDLDAATLTDVKNFYYQWYTPANATLVVAGDFKKKDVKALVTKWFGTFPKSDKPSVSKVEVPDGAGKTVTVKEKLAKFPMLTMAWHTPAFFAPGDAEFDLLGNALGAEGTGRLHKKLVLETKLAQRVSVGQNSQQLSSMFTVSVLLRPGASVDEVKKIVEKEMANIRESGVTAKEFSRAVINFESQFVWGLQSLLARAELLQRYNHYVGDPGYLSKDLNRYRKTTSEKVRDMARKYLSPQRVFTIITAPTK